MNTFAESVPSKEILIYRKAKENHHVKELLFTLKIQNGSKFMRTVTKTIYVKGTVLKTVSILFRSKIKIRDRDALIMD